MAALCLTTGQHARTKIYFTHHTRRKISSTGCLDIETLLNMSRVRLLQNQILRLRNKTKSELFVKGLSAVFSKIQLLISCPFG